MTMAKIHLPAEGVDPCTILEWDSAFWGVRMAKVQGDSLTEERVRAIDAWCKGNHIRCLYFLARPDDPTTTRVAEESHFRLVDIRMTLERRCSGMWTTGPQEVTGPIAVRQCRPDDVPFLQTIAQDIYRDTRFYHDDHFPKDRCRLLYETWIKRSCEGYADMVLVADLERTPAGYVTCHLERETLSGSIGLVGVSQWAQGRSVGQMLVRHAVDWFTTQGIQNVTVVTQGRNYAAQRLYQRCGFVTGSIHLWYHKWYVPQVI
jgi:dTDP-4-amino-4,6-dideoxy-D-galactose acyltransferase